MGEQLRLLILEDSDDDTLLLVRRLKQGGFDLEYEQTDTADGLREALAKRPWDAVISDYAMPNFNGIAALKIFKECRIDIPFIIVSGTIGEDVAVLAMKEGAHDYLMKDKLERLVPALQRELGEAKIRRERKLAEAERRNLEERLHQAQKLEAIGTLARGIAHDFNNILFSMIGFTEMAMEELEPESQAGTCLDQVMIAQKRAVNLVNQILTFSRQTELESKPMQLQPVIREAVSLLHGSISPRIKIQEEINPACGPVRADPTKIHQVIMNLCTNAIHALGEKGGTLRISLAPMTIDPTGSAPHHDLEAGDYLRLTVADTGQGMDEETRDRIFDPYFTTKEPGEGSGLGLSTVHGIIQKCNGSIHVESEPGQGSAFHITLPLCTEKTTQRKPLPEKARHGGASILFVDDEKQVSLFVKMALEDLGYRIHTRTSSVEALEAFRANPGRFDLVITDQAMPGMTGSELARRILAARRDIPIILCTGFSEGTLRDQAREIGIKECVNKPILIRDLAAAIQRSLKPDGAPS